MKKRGGASELIQIDRIKTIAIRAMFSDDILLEHLVLKGGNAIDLAHHISARASKDLDFSMGSDFESTADFGQRIKTTLESEFQNHQFRLFDFKFRAVPTQMDEDIADFWGGYQGEFKVIRQDQHSKLGDDIEILRRHAEVIGGEASRNFKIDISKHEYRGSIQVIKMDHLNIAVYTPQMIVAEKLRAICQQMPEYSTIVHRNRTTAARARDFLDIYSICNHTKLKGTVDFGAPSFRDLVGHVFRAKRTPLRLLGQIVQTFDIHVPDFASVLATVRQDVVLPSHEFKFYFDYVIDRCNQLQPLWNIDSPS